MKSQAAIEADIRYRQRNKARIADVSRRYYQANKKAYRARELEWKQKNPEGIKAIQARYRQRHPDRVRETRKRNREKMQILNPFSLKVLWNLRRRTRRVLKGKRRSDKMCGLLGCSYDEFRLHMVRKFQLGMTMFNYGTVWHIDHIVPCGTFDLSNPDEQRRCFHYTNLMPLFAGQNMRKQP